ncbi:MAG TPA: hypothetical protein VM030_07660 [Acidimicrobiales bacterium]|nr:hypothetical protein [Acidimicrobiales bacterium]
MDHRARHPRVANYLRVVVVLALAAPFLGDGAHARSGFTYSGRGCASVRAVFAVPVDQARAFVPPSFRIFDLGAGVATGKATITRCDLLTVGPVTGPGSFSSVTIDIEPPAGAPGTSEHGYELWHVSNRHDLADRYRAAGVRGDVVGELSLESLTPDPVASAHGDAPWPRASFGLTVVTPDPTDGVPTKHNESEWHVAGTTRLRTLSNYDEIEHAGAAVLTTGGDFDRLMGLPAAPAAGLLRTFSFTAKVEAL